MLTGKTILVTGGAGFIGSHLCERLFSDGNRVISIDNYFAGSRDNHIDGVLYIDGHTKDIDKLMPVVPDIVFHLGEYSRVEKSYDEPELVFDLNTIGTFAVIRYCLKNNCKLVYAGSSTKFADDGKHQSPYAFSKASSTELITDYGKWYGLNYAIAYFYNVYGGRERSDGKYATLISIYKNRYLNNEPLLVVSPGTQLRNFTHIDDTVDALVLIGEKGEGDEYGIGAEESFSILDVAQMFNTKVEIIPERKGNRMTAKVYSDKTKDIGWTQKHRLDNHVSEFINNHPK